MLLKGNKGWKLSPDSSGYAAWGVSLYSVAAAFERIAGSPSLNAFYRSASKKISLCKLRVNNNRF